MLSKCGLKPQLQHLDNKASEILKQHITNNNTKIQLTSVGEHRTNLAEQEIQTWKNHFVAGLATTHPKFPLHLWDRLLPQANIALNLLRPSRLNSSLSSYQQLQGNFSYNKHPIVPPGMRVMAHIQPNQRKSWEANVQQSFYLYPALNHYRYHRVYITKTLVDRVINQLV